MRRHGILIALAAVLVLAVVSLIVGRRRLPSYIEGRLEALTGADVTVRHFRISPLACRIAAAVRLRDAQGGLLDVKRAEAEIALRPLLSGRLKINKLRLNGAQVTVSTQAGGYRIHGLAMAAGGEIGGGAPKRLIIEESVFTYKGRRIELHRFDMGGGRKTALSLWGESDGVSLRFQGTGGLVEGLPRAAGELKLEGLPAAGLSRRSMRVLTGELALDGKIQVKAAKDFAQQLIQWDGRVDWRGIEAVYRSSGTTLHFLSTGTAHLAGLRVGLPERRIFVEQAVTSTGTVVEVLDKSFARPPRLRLEPFAAVLSGLEVAASSWSAKLRLDARTQHRGRLASSFNLVSMNGVPSGELGLELNDMQLAPLSAYAERYLGSKVKTGILDLKAEARLTNGVIEGVKNYRVRKLDLDWIWKGDQDAVQKRLGVSLGTLLSLMTNKDGDVILSVPVSGKISELEFGTAGIAQRLLVKGLGVAAVKAAETAFPPLKVARLAAKGAGFLFKWRFKDIRFAPGQDEMAPESAAYLREVGEKLREKIGVSIRICGRAVAADPAPPLSMAEQRAKRVQTLLIEEFSIAPERLVLCAPVIDEGKDAVPIVELSL
ncbi:MAG: DUF748 domain-containing protein [Elusimicrobiota bacterium]